MKPRLWTRNYTLLIAATTLGAIGGTVGGFALSFLVFDETGSTLAAALIVAIQLIPYFVLPLFLAPLMDRLPRKPFLVGGDVLNGLLYALMGLYLLRFRFSYAGYLAYSLLLACLGSFDELAYSSIYPKLIPEGLEQKGYAVSTTLYPLLRVLMTPLAAVLMDTLGAAWMLIAQGGLSILAALTESGIRLSEQRRLAEGQRFSLRLWRQDTAEAIRYLRNEPGLMNIFSYSAVTNGVGNGYYPVLVAFFRTAPGFSAGMYSFFTVAEFLGRTLGGAVQYHVTIPNRKKYGFVFFVQQFYELMDMCLLWLPYPAMLVNRGLCGFLGANSATLREAAVQRYIPESLRARVNAFSEMMIMASISALSLVIGALGEVMDYRLCLTLCGAATALACWLTIWRGRKPIRRIYEPETPDAGCANAQKAD